MPAAFRRRRTNVTARVCLPATAFARCPHLSWTGFGLRVPATGAPLHVGRRADSCSISVWLVKLWFSVSRTEQRRRFREHEVHPLEQWKLSPIDKRSLDKWDDDTVTEEAMFCATDMADAPWTVIKSDCKKRARLNAMRYVLRKLPSAGKDMAQVGKFDPLIVGRAHVVYEQGERPGAGGIL